jgi:hypothetical protein
MNTIRTTVRIPEPLYRSAKVHAARTGKNLTGLITEALTNVVYSQPAPKEQQTAADVLLKLAELGKKHNIQAPPDMSRRIDDYLYGDED